MLQSFVTPPLDALGGQGFQFQTHRTFQARNNSSLHPPHLKRHIGENPTFIGSKYTISSGVFPAGGPIPSLNVTSLFIPFAFSSSTSQSDISATKSCGLRHLMMRPFQISGTVRTRWDLGEGLMGWVLEAYMTTIAGWFGFGEGMDCVGRYWGRIYTAPKRYP